MGLRGEAVSCTQQGGRARSWGFTWVPKMSPISATHGTLRAPSLALANTPQGRQQGARWCLVLALPSRLAGMGGRLGCFLHRHCGLQGQHPWVLRSSLPACSVLPKGQSVPLPSGRAWSSLHTPLPPALVPESFPPASCSGVCGWGWGGKEGPGEVKPRAEKPRAQLWPPLPPHPHRVPWGP